MTNKYEETEAKFYLSRLPRLEARLLEVRARLVHKRTYERNLRFDDADGTLARTGQVLRLRQDDRVWLTYKGAGLQEAGMLTRREVELEVGSFETARTLLQDLGYQVIFVYEKYRTTYAVDATQIMLDELPYGAFAELEGQTAAILESARALGLDMGTAISRSYHSLFADLCRARDLTFNDLTFDNFVGLAITPTDLGVIPADT